MQWDPGFPHLVLNVTSLEDIGRLSTDFTQNTSGPWLRKCLDRGIHSIANFNKHVFKLHLQNFILRRTNKLECLFEYEFCISIQRIGKSFLIAN